MLGQKVDTPMTGIFRGLFTWKNFLKYGTIGIAVIVVAAIIYYNTQMKPHDLVSMFQSDLPPVSGELVRYDTDQNRVELELTDEAMIAPVWEAMQVSQVRYFQHIGSAVAPAGGYYYEIMLATAEDTDAHSYAFSTNSDGEAVIRGMTYYYVDKEPILEALDAVFTQYEDQVTPAS